MHSSVAILCFAVVLFHGATSRRLHPHTFVEGFLKKIDSKRQSTDDQIQCINDNLDEDRLNSACLAAADEGLDLDFADPGSIQGTLNQAFSAFCQPECGNAILSVYDKCGTFGVDGLEKFLVGLCGTNENGEKCYEDYVDSITLYATEATCFGLYQQSGTCGSTCENQLSSGADDLGCCLDVYQDFFEGIADVGTRDIYGDCGVDLPGGCNNSPISGSVSVVFNVATLTVALGLYVISG
jgi:hypothetical protein